MPRQFYSVHFKGELLGLQGREEEGCSWLRDPRANYLLCCRALEVDGPCLVKENVIARYDTCDASLLGGIWNCDYRDSAETGDS